MYEYNFFNAARDNNFKLKLNAAISIIQKNQSVVARQAFKVIISGKVTIHSFNELSRKKYFEMKNEMLEDHQIYLPAAFPPTESAVQQIESVLDGIIYSNKHIYISSQQNIEKTAHTLIHEIGHFLNNSLYDKARLIQDDHRAGYDDEVRAFIAEKNFKNNGRCLMRSDIRKIHRQVARFYPEFMDSTEDTSNGGFVFSTYDAPY